MKKSSEWVEKINSFLKTRRPVTSEKTLLRKLKDYRKDMVSAETEARSRWNDSEGDMYARTVKACDEWISQLTANPVKP